MLKISFPPIQLLQCCLVQVIKSVHLIGSFRFERRPVWIRTLRARLLNSKKKRKRQAFSNSRSSNSFESFLLIFKFFSVTRECRGKLAELKLNDAALIFNRSCPYLQIARCCLSLYSWPLCYATQIRANR